MSPRTRHLALLLSAGALCYLPFLGGVHLFDWDEINFAEISREMLLTGEFLRVNLDFRPFWEKPPLFFWLQAAAMAALGVGEYAARLPNAVNGLITLALVYHIGSRLHNPRFGLLWGLAWLGATLPLLYAKSGIIDPWFNLFIFLGLWLFIRFYWQRHPAMGYAEHRPGWLLLLGSGLAVGLGVLTKGPVALLLAGLTMAAYWVTVRFRWYVRPLHFLAFLLAVSVAMLAWFGVETLRNGTWFVEEFTRYQIRLLSTPDAGHRGFPGYHAAVLLLGLFPASLFALRAFGKLPAEDKTCQADFTRWMKILFWVVLLLFSLIRTKIVHYSSMAYLPMTYLGALVMFHAMAGRLRLGRGVPVGLVAVGALYILAAAALPFLGRHPELLEPLLAKDPFGRANLEAAVHWSGWEALPALWLAIVLILALRELQRQRWRRALPILFGGNALFVLGVLVADVGKIEAYSQRAAIAFFQERQGEDCYVRNVGYKSYAQLFYTRKAPVTEPRSYDQEWLLRGDIDKPAYFVTRIHRTDAVAGVPGVREIGRRNGFVFFRRDPLPAGTDQ